MNWLRLRSALSAAILAALPVRSALASDSDCSLYQEDLVNVELRLTKTSEPIKLAVPRNRISSLRGDEKTIRVGATSLIGGPMPPGTPPGAMTIENVDRKRNYPVLISFQGTEGLEAVFADHVDWLGGGRPPILLTPNDKYYEPSLVGYRFSRYKKTAAYKFIDDGKVTDIFTCLDVAAKFPGYAHKAVNDIVNYQISARLDSISQWRERRAWVDAFLKCTVRK